MIFGEAESVSLIEYRARVRRAARRKNGEPIYNGTTEHAQIVIESLFDVASSEVCVLNQSVNNKVMGDEATLDAIERFLTRPHAELRVLVEQVPKCGWESNHFVSRFAERDNVEMRQVTPEAQGRYNFHFTVADADSYRFEPDKTKHAAIASFGNQTAAHLAAIFGQLWPDGRPLSL